MGFSWSVYCCQCAGEALFKRATRPERCLLVDDRGRAPIFRDSPGQENDNDDKFGNVYVDDIRVLATSPAKARELMGKLTTTFDDAGLLTHEVSVSDSQGVAFGRVLDCELRRSSLAPRRFLEIATRD